MQSEPNTPQIPFQINVADRVKRLPPYLFGKINELKQRKRRAGADVIDLGMGNPTDVPDPQVIDKLCEAARDERNHRYSVSNGLRNLRREVALRYERRHGVQLDPDSEVLAGLGSKEVFSHMCLALLGPGDTAVVPAPSFPIHVYAVMLASGNVMSLDCTQPDRFLAKVASVAEHLYPRPKVLILNFPHNPSTTVVEKDFFVDVVALARRFGFMVVHDFAYGDVCFDGYRAPSFLSVPGAKEVGVETITMSKGYNMAGWRLGFCAGNAEMIRALATIKGYYDYGIFQPIQIAGIVALRECEDLVERQALEYQRRRDVLVDGLLRMGWEVTPPKASMFVWAKYPKEWARKLGSIELAMKLLDEGDVAVSPGGGFGDAGEGYLRLALVENEHRLRQASGKLHDVCGRKWRRAEDRLGVHVSETYVSTDVEADGPIPGPNSLLSFGSAAYTADKRLVSTFAANLQTLPGASGDPKTMAWWQTQPEAWEMARRDPQDPAVAMPAYVNWVKSLPGSPVFVAYPAAYDFLFVYWYIMRFVGESPFSHSALDIKTYAMALLKQGYRQATKRSMPAPLV